MSRTVAQLLNDLLAPVQPEDCRAASLALALEAVEASGPVVYRGHVVTVKAGEVEFDRTRMLAEFPDVEVPSDAELAEAWKIRAAESLTLPLADVASDKHDVT